MCLNNQIFIQYSWTPSTTNSQSGIFEAGGDPAPTYNGSVASPSWFAYDLDDDEMSEGPLAQHAVDYIHNLSNATIPDAVGRPFFLVCFVNTRCTCPKLVTASDAMINRPWDSTNLMYHGTLPKSTGTCILKTR